MSFQFSYVSVAWVIKAIVVSVPSQLERSGCMTHICLNWVLVGLLDLGLVNDIFGQALLTHGAFGWVSAVACSCLVIFFLHELFLVPRNLPSHVWHAAVAQFYCVPVKYFRQRVWRGETCVQNIEKTLPNVCVDQPAEGRVIPYWLLFPWTVLFISV